MELDAIHSMMTGGDQVEEITVMSRKFNCGHRGSQDLEDSARGRPSSPRYNPSDEVVACEDRICSNPSRVIGAGRSRSTKANGSNVHEAEGVGFVS